MKSILILTASFGDGHNAAAQNIRDALEQISPEAEVTVADLFERSYKRINGAVRHAPRLWTGVFKLVDHAPWLTESGLGMRRLQQALAELLEATRPDCVVSTYPTYGPLIHTRFRDPRARPFRLVTVITDARSINSVWHRAPSDQFVVCDEETATVLDRAGVPHSTIQPFGFPVSPRFAQPLAEPPLPPRAGQPFRVLYVISTGKQKAGKAIDRLLDIPRVELTVTTGRHSELKEKLAKRARKHDERLRLLGWTNQMPELLLRSHLVIAKAGVAAVQEAIAARCPMIVNQVIPGQEAGNARLVKELGIGVLAERKREVTRRVREALADDGNVWSRWRSRLDQISRPDASLRIAQLILEECERAKPCGRPAGYPAPRPINGHGTRALPARLPLTARPQAAAALLCDFHIHSNYSDGRLTVPEVVDFYGRRGFDCICITDHWTDPRRLVGKFSRLASLALSYDQVEEYFEVIAREARRAWRRYELLVLTGLEFNQDGPTRKSAAPLLGLDLREPISPRLDLLETIERIHAQGGLAVAAHPNPQKSAWAKDTLYLWEHQPEFAPLIDAWEIANRNQLVSAVSRQRLPILAGSDFHKPKHIYSWKTLLHCEKHPAAIKECIRRNQHVSIARYHGDGADAMASIAEADVFPPFHHEDVSPLTEALPSLAFPEPQRCLAPCHSEAP